MNIFCCLLIILSAQARLYRVKYDSSCGSKSVSHKLNVTHCVHNSFCSFLRSLGEWVHRNDDESSTNKRQIWKKIINTLLVTSWPESLEISWLWRSVRGKGYSKEKPFIVRTRTNVLLIAHRNLMKSSFVNTRKFIRWVNIMLEIT